MAGIEDLNLTLHVTVVSMFESHVYWSRVVAMNGTWFDPRVFIIIIDTSNLLRSSLQFFVAQCPNHLQLPTIPENVSIIVFSSLQKKREAVKGHHGTLDDS